MQMAPMTRTSLGSRWKRLTFALRGGDCLNGIAEETTARGFHLLLTCALIWILLLLVVVAFFAVRSKEGAVVVIVLGATTVAALRLVRANRIRPAALLFVTIYWCVAEGFSALSGGLRSGTYGLVVLIIVNAGWLLGRSSAIGLAAATLVASFAEVVFQYSRPTLPPYFPGTPIGNWLIFIGILLFAVNPTLTLLEALQKQVSSLRASEERWHLALGGTNDGMWDWDARTDQVFFSARWKEMLGYQDHEIINHPQEWKSRVHPEDLPRVLGHLDDHQNHKTPFYAAEYRMRARDGSYRWILARGKAQWDENGHAIRLVGSHTDITEHKLAAESLCRAKEAAEDASRSKGEFLANMSHEIRTPMTGVLGMIDLTLSSELNATQREYLVTARLSADSLLALLNDILDLSKIEAGRLDLSPKAFWLRECVGDAVHMFALPAGRKGLTLTCEISPEVPDAVVGDQLRIRQVLINLLGNATKFTDHGGITVRVQKVTEPGQADLIKVAVEDTGIGIAPDKQALVFDPFQQVDGSSTRRQVGTGLGLTISARLVKLMGGNIGLQSELGSGSTFTFVVPLVPADPTFVPGQRVPGALIATKGPAVLPLRILLAEDNQVNQKVISGLLKRDRHDVVVVSDGQEAVDAVRERAFDVVLMDVQMPVMDGFAATAAIREIERQSGRRTSVVALTANAMKGDEEKCLAAGMDAYLSKPIMLPALRGTLASLVSRDGGPEPANTRADAIVR
jgi:PAS domain S-box-containing protein